MTEISGSTPTFESDIKPLFRERDRGAMRSHFDLWSYDDVRANADPILAEVSSGSMPCDAPWPSEKVDLLQGLGPFSRGRFPTGRRPRRSAIAVAGLLVAAAAGFAISALAQNSSRPASGGPGRLEPGITTLGNANPFDENGKLVTLQQFVAGKAREGYDVPLPDSPLANPTNVGNVWESTTGEVISYYPSSGIELNYGGTGIDYTGFAADDIKAINGIRAIVLPADDPRTFGLAEVMLPLPSGHLVTLLSRGAVSDLVSVAQTMQVNGKP